MAAFALYETTDIRKLSPDERQLFELKVVTENGGWLGKVGTKQFWEELAKKAVEKMDGRTIGGTILGCAALATGYFAYDSHNHRVVAEKQEETAKAQEVTKQIQQQEESRRVAALVSALKAKDALFYDTMMGNTDAAMHALTERLAKRGHNASLIAVGGKTYDCEAIAALNARTKSEPEEPLTVSGVFDVVELNKKTEKWSMQIRSVETREDLTFYLSEDALDMDLAEAQKTVSDAFYVDQKIAAVVVCGKWKCLLNNVKLVEKDE